MMEMSIVVSKSLVFVSYAKEDAEFALRIKQCLLSTASLTKYDVFCSEDGTSLTAGVDYVTEIKRAINSAYCHLLVLSPAFMNSPFCLAELGAMWGQPANHPYEIFALLTPGTRDDILNGTPLEHIQTMKIENAVNWCNRIFHFLEKNIPGIHDFDLVGKDANKLFEEKQDLTKNIQMNNRLQAHIDHGSDKMTAESAKQNLEQLLISKGSTEISVAQFGISHAGKLFMETKYSSNYRKAIRMTEKVWHAKFTFSQNLVKNLSEHNITDVTLMVGYYANNMHVNYDYLIIPISDFMEIIQDIRQHDLGATEYQLCLEKDTDNCITEYGGIVNSDFNQYLNRFVTIS